MNMAEGVPIVPQRSAPFNASNSGGLSLNGGQWSGRGDDAGGARTGFDEQCVVFRLVAFAAAAGNHHV
jgi:hypothetical protein